MGPDRDKSLDDLPLFLSGSAAIVHIQARLYLAWKSVVPQSLGEVRDPLGPSPFFDCGMPRNCCFGTTWA